MRADIFNAVAIIIASYLIGSLPFGLILSKTLRGIDPRTQGSGNIGATNVWRVVGKKEGVITVLCDLLKGMPLLLLAKTIEMDSKIVYLVALAAVFGHIFSIFLNFKGGKGVATSLGVLLMLSPKLVLVASLFWAVSVFLSKISSVGALTAFSLLPILAYFLQMDRHFLLLVTTISLLVLVRHRENIRRLLKGKEQAL